MRPVQRKPYRNLAVAIVGWMTGSPIDNHLSIMYIEQVMRCPKERLPLMPLKNNALAWYEHALKTGDDSVARFMMHWIAFNFKYSEYRRKKENDRWNSEREQIVLLCEDMYDDLKKYDPFVENPSEVQRLIKLPVYNGRSVPKKTIEPRLPPNRKEPLEMRANALWSVLRLDHKPGRYHNSRRMKCLLLTLYQVRCNLFHGSKNPDFPRDEMLVKDAAAIIEGYMRSLLHIDSSSQ